MKKKLSLPVLILDPANFIGGAECFMLDFLRYTTSKKNYTFIVGTTGNKEYVSQIPAHCKIFKLPLPRLRLFSLSSLLALRRSVREISSFVEKKKIALIISNSVRSHVIASFVSKKTHVPLLWMMHDFTFPRMILSYLAKVPVRIVCVSYAVRKYVLLATRGKWKEKMVVIPNGVDLANIQQQAAMNIKLPLKRNEIWVGTIGRIERWKGQEYFIRAAIKMLNLVPRARFFIIGSPTEYDRKTIHYFEMLKRLVVHNRLTTKVNFTGYLPNVYPLLSKLDILVHTAIEPEPFGRVVLEGMAMKKPVIASPLGGPSEVIKDGSDGFLVDPKDTTRLASVMMELASAQHKRDMVGEAAYQKVSQFYTTKIVYDKLFTHIKMILS